jgi:hypothetical protein
VPQLGPAAALDAADVAHPDDGDPHGLTPRGWLCGNGVQGVCRHQGQGAGRLEKSKTLCVQAVMATNTQSCGRLPELQYKGRLAPPFAEGPRQMVEPLPICRAEASPTANGEARAGLRPDRNGVSFYPCGCSGQTPQDIVPSPLSPPGQMSTRSGLHKCQKPGHLAACASGPDKCPSRKPPRTNVQAPSGRGQMSKPWTAAGKCRSPSHLPSGETAPGKCRSPSANAGRPNRPRQMERHEPARGAAERA